MPIVGSDPVIVPAVAQQTYDAWWITNLSIQAPSPTGKVRAFATLVPYNSQTQAIKGDQPVSLSILDLFGAAQTDATISAAMTAIYAAVQSQATAQNLI